MKVIMMKFRWTVFLISLLWVSLSFAAEETFSRSAILGNDPAFDTTAHTSPLNKFIKKMFRPEETLEERSNLEAPYEEAIPYGLYYPDGGTYYEEIPPPQAASPKQEGSYYQEGGSYYQESGQYYQLPKKDETP